MAFGALAGSVAILVAESYLPVVEQWIRSNQERIIERVRMVVVALIFLSTVPLVGLAAYLFLLGHRIRRSERFPLEGERLVRDTVILRGDQAVFRGRVLQGMALALVLFAGGLAVAFWRIVSLLGQPRG